MLHLSRRRSGGAIGALFARKPVVPTPTAQTPLRTFYVDASGGSDSNDGLTTGTPFLTIGKTKTISQAGDRFYCKGTFTGVNERLGDGGGAGTSTNHIQYVVWPGQTCTFNMGGSGDGYPVLYINSSHPYYWIQGIRLEHPATTGRTVWGQSGAHHWWFINCTTDGGYYVYGATDFYSYGCTWDGTLGTAINNDGDALIGFEGADRHLFVRCTFSGNCYHGIGGPGWLQEGGTGTCSAWRFFDCDFANTKAGGIWAYGLSRGLIVEWCRFTGVGSDYDLTYPPASMDAMYIQGQDTIFRYNIVKGCQGGVWCLAYWFGGLTSGTATAGGASTITLAAGSSGTNDFYANGGYITLTGGTGSGQVRTISAYNGTTKVATVSSAWTTQPDATTTYAINHYNYNFQTFNGSRVYGNVITGNLARYGFQVFTGPVDAAHPITPDTDATDLHIVNNILWNNGTVEAEGGGYFESEWYPLWLSNYQSGTSVWTQNATDIGGLVIKNNNLSRSTSDTRAVLLSRAAGGGGNVKYTLASLQSTYSGYTGNLNDTDPLFVSSSDFHLQAGSPCINAGYVVTDPETVTYLSTAPDMGVFEYGGAD